MSSRELLPVRALDVELVEPGAENARVPVGRLHGIEQAVIAERIESGDHVVRARPVRGRAFLVWARSAAGSVVGVLEIENGGRVVGLGRGDLFHIDKADTVCDQAVE